MYTGVIGPGHVDDVTALASRARVSQQNRFFEPTRPCTRLSSKRRRTRAQSVTRALTQVIKRAERAGGYSGALVLKPPIEPVAAAVHSRR